MLEKKLDSVEGVEYARLYNFYKEQNLNHLYEERRATEETIDECIKTKNYDYISGFWKEYYVLNEIINRKEGINLKKALN